MPGRSVSKWGAFLDDVAGFDADFLRYQRTRECRDSIPQHRLLLETSWEAMEHAGLAREALSDSPTGVFVGLTHADYQMLAADAQSLEAAYGFSGNNFSLASGRIAYALGVHGPALTVDTACSSGLTAIHLACRSLHEGESDFALAGGATLALDPRKFASGSARGNALGDRTLPCLRCRSRRIRRRRRLRRWCCSSGCRTPCVMATGSSPSSAARPPTRTVIP